MSIAAEHQQRIEQLLKQRWPGARINTFDVVQSLWSDYGSIVRISITQSDDVNAPASIVAKVIVPPSNASHPRGWNTDASKLRKLRSYQVERHFYESYSARCSDDCLVPQCFAASGEQDAVTLLLEDLDANFPVRRSQLSINTVLVCLSWLAAFHAKFLGIKDDALWERGTYWHLDTRKDEFNAMPDGALKLSAHALDARLNHCQFQTLLHGDAKVANFCFSESGDAVAAVDFQYTGTGCGMKDVVYFLGSCLPERNWREQEASLLEHYFSELKTHLNSNVKNLRADGVDVQALEAEWRENYAVAGADFHRFLAGWSPGHAKLTPYSEELVARALSTIADYS